MRLIYIFPPDEIPQPPNLRIEESEWTCKPAPIWFSLLAPSPWTFEQNESPTLQTGLDFSETLPLVAPVAVYAVPFVYTADDVFVAAQPTLAADEENEVVHCTSSFSALPVPRIFWDDETLVPVPPIQDEDFWINPVASVFAYAVKVFSDDDFLVPQPPCRDEDYWQNAVAPMPAQNFLLLPYLPDADEIPAGFLFAAILPESLGFGTITESSGAGSVTIATGVGQANLANGTGRIN
jgi:hypothetical protein